MNILPIRTIGASLLLTGATGAALVSSLANQRLKAIPIDADLAAILELSKAEEDANQAQRNREETALQNQLVRLGKKLGNRVRDDGRCLFYAADADAEKVLDMLEKEGEDVTSMRGPKKNYPFAEREHCKAVARHLDSTLRVYTFGYYEDFGSGEHVVEVALLGNHYWPVKDA